MSEIFERIRYGRFTKGVRRGQRRSTLVTLQQGDRIFFGLSKCHKGLDRWNREQGLKYARVRAQAAMRAFQNGDTGNWSENNGVTIQEDGVLGHCAVADVKNLLNYFQETTIFLPKQDQHEVEEAVA